MDPSFESIDAVLTWSVLKTRKLEKYLKEGEIVDTSDTKVERIVVLFRMGETEMRWVDERDEGVEGKTN